ncbi:aldo-keto reductase family 1 member B1-like isoform X3 [Teleopsis dalmanni]|nr:aldo-keto reductase family 1 member B1-like isoform X3 [Teleopsis dalmanni]XP_037936755.1 aldo-keto reductase family 1 member B1-like isoform X3 [Teleopsis dalmanni]
MLGLGTWNSLDYQVGEAVMTAIDAGYRHFDCAHAHHNEQQIGLALRAMFRRTQLSRKDIFITSKLWNTFHRPSLVRLACETSLKNLQTDYLDLYLMHWPMAFKEGNDLIPLDSEGEIIFSYNDFVDTWMAMEKLVEDGLCKAIGLSNFNETQIERLLKNASIYPAVNQIECHPYLTQKKLKEFCESKDIAVIAYSPLGLPRNPFCNSCNKPLIQRKEITQLAKLLHKTPAQILIRYQLQRGNIVIPKSVTKAHIRSNILVNDFELTEEAMKMLNKLNINYRHVHFKTARKHPDYPFK